MNQEHINRIKQIGDLYPRTLFVIPSGQAQMRSHSVAHRFKAHADFLYLFGIEIENATALIFGKEIYLCVDEEISKWDDNNQIHDKLYQDKISWVSNKSRNEVINELITRADRIATPIGIVSQNDLALLDLIRFGNIRKRRSSNPILMCDSRSLIGVLRLHKSNSEIELMRTACLKSSEVHNLLMSKKIIGLTEKQVANWIEHEFLMRDMQWCSYETIVGSGFRSTLLHARASNKVIQEDEMIVIDAGAEWNSYCSDITRTIPSGSILNKEQRLVYKIVLDVQKKLLSFTKSGTSIAAIDELTKKLLHHELQEKLNTNITAADFMELMPHSTSHWIGLDVHDPCPYFTDNGSPIVLQNGMTFTVEPGLYFKKDNPVSRKLAGIGIRIEDDVVVENEKLEVLTTAIKEVEEIEQQRSLCL